MVYQAVVGPVLEEVFRGYNCTIFAYGQTGTGKTHTMEGDLTSQLGTYSAEAGIIPRTLYRLFHQLELSDNEFAVHASFVELYNEELRDLLSMEPVSPLNNGGLKMYDDKEKGVVIQGLEDTPMTGAEHGLELLRRGSRRRQIAATKCNESSSRSHSVFSLTVKIKETTAKGEEVVRVGKLNLVDLAGSENIGRSGAENKRAREAGMINQSLLTLGRVINALVENSPHKPYRESKLTRLLAESLGGRTKTCIIATVSSEKTNLEETLSTLDYALRAKSIRNRPEMNSRMTRAGLIMEYVKEIERLKRDLLAARSQEGFYTSNESIKEMQDESDSRRNAADELRRMVEVAESKRTSLQEQFEQNMQLLGKREGEFKALRAECSEKRRELDGVIDRANELQVALAEEQELREAYRNSEKKLNRIAGGLRDQAEESRADLGGLFDKLARKAQVEGANRQVVSEYRSIIEGTSSQLQSQANSFNSAQRQFTGMLQSTLRGFHQEELESLRAGQRDVESRMASLQKSIDQLGQGQTASRDSMQSFAQLVQEGKDDLVNTSNQRAKSLQDDWAVFRKEIEAAHEASATTSRKHQGSVQELVGEIVKQAQEHIEAEQAQIAEVKAFAEEASQREIATLREQNELLSTLLSEERQKSTAMREKLAKNISDLLVGYTEERDRSLTDAITTVKRKNTASEADALQFVEGHSERMDAISQAAVDLGQGLEEKDRLCRKIKKRGSAGLQEHGETVRKAVRSWDERLGQHTFEGQEQLQEIASRLQDQSEEAKQEAGVAHDSMADQLAQLTQTASEGNATSISTLQTTLSHIEALKTTTSSHLDSHSEASTSYLTSTLEHLTQLQGDTRRYLEEGYAEDISTGQTPQRKEVTGAPPAWKLVPAARNQALEQYRHLVEKKMQAVAQAARKESEEASGAIRGRPSVASSEVDGTMGTLPDDTRATMDWDGDLQDTRSHHEGSQAASEGERAGTDDEEEEELEISLREPHTDSDDTVKLTKPEPILAATTTNKRFSTVRPQAAHGRGVTKSRTVSAATAPPTSRTALVEKNVSVNGGSEVVAATTGGKRKASAATTTTDRGGRRVTRT